MITILRALLLLLFIVIKEIYISVFLNLVRRNKPITRENENPLTYLALGSRGQHQHISWHMLEV